MTFGNLCSFNIIGTESSQLTVYQEQALMESFQAKRYLKKDQRDQLAKALNITESRIKKWYENRRSACRKRGLLAKGAENSTKYLLLIILLRVMHCYSQDTILYSV